MTEVPITMCSSKSEVNESLNLGISREELEQSDVSNAVLQGTALGIYYKNGLFLSISFTSTEGKITGIQSYDAAPLGISHFHAFLDGTVMLGKGKMRVSYDDADKELNDGDNIHISQLVKELLLYKEIIE